MIESNIPFIKKFRLDDDYYIYDVNSNEFFRVDEAVYYLIDKNQNDKETDSTIKKIPLSQIDTAEKNIQSKKELGYFSNKRPIINYFKSESFSQRLAEAQNSKLEKITLVLTESCTMRCKYCAYSGHYTYHRSHSNRNMSPGIMKKAVDFYFAHSQEKQEKFISFYGGEPVKNFDLLKQCVHYVLKKYAVDTKYNLTLNGTLLSKAIEKVHGAWECGNVEIRFCVSC